MNILLLGGNGFIGSHLQDRLLAWGHRVSVFDRAYEKWRQPLEGVRYFIGSFEDSSLLYESMLGVDIVVHLISTTVPSTSALNPVADIEGNLINTVKLLDVLKKTEVTRLVYFSSGGAVYGIPNLLPVKEDARPEPISSYGIVKLAIEKYIQAYARTNGFSFLILRPSNPYGPRQGHEGLQGAVSTFLYRVLNKQPVVIWGDGSVVRDYIHVDDLAEFFVGSINNNLSGIFNVGAGEGHSLNDILQVLTESGVGEVRVEYREGRDFDVPEIVLDTEKARNEFGWKPKFTLRSGINDFRAWVLSQGLI
jgi:UDP-glucose 4-epimerase